MGTVPDAAPRGLSQQQRADAWRLAFTCSLDRLPDREIAWEAETWRTLDTPGVTRICERALHERENTNLSIDGGSSPHDLNLLWRRIDQAEALRLVRHEGLSLVEAARTIYWLRVRSGRAA